MSRNYLGNVSQTYRKIVLSVARQAPPRDLTSSIQIVRYNVRRCQTRFTKLSTTFFTPAFSKLTVSFAPSMPTMRP